MDIWKYHNAKMTELKKLYNKTSKQTQNRMQELLDTFNFEFDTLYNIADNETKKRVDTYIEEWKEQNLLNGMFGMLAKNIYSRTRVKNSEILELLIYSAYIEEQNKLNETELNIFKDITNFYYQQGQQEVIDTLSKNKKRKTSIIPEAIFLALLDTPNSKGYIWNDYIQATIKYNAEQICRQAIIDMQQQKELKIEDDVYQWIIKKQQNAKLCINGDKITGAIDNQLIGMNNLAKSKGIVSIDKNAEVIFISDMCENVTDMCSNMNGMKFKVDGENEFDRYYGETQKELRWVRVKCHGLKLGINLPPIRTSLSFMP